MSEEVLYLLLSFIFFALLHSLMAATYLKGFFTRWCGLNCYNKYYRLVYTILSMVSIVPVIYFLFTDSSLIWSAPAWLAFVLYFIKGLASIGFLYSIWQIDGLHFLGIRQLKVQHGRQAIQLSDALVTTGVFGLCRHPLYFFSMLFLWASPTMYWHALVFTILTSVYFVIGSYWEEAKMLQQFGTPYRRYQQQVPRFIPSFFIRRYFV